MPDETSVTAERAPAANAPPSIARATVTVKPVAGAWLVESVIRNLKFAIATFFLMPLWIRMRVPLRSTAVVGLPMLAQSRPALPPAPPSSGGPAAGGGGGRANVA